MHDNPSKAESVLLVHDPDDATSGSEPWLWYPYLPAGDFVTLDGDPGLGKSLLATYLMARVSRGELEGQRGVPGGALLFSAEDCPTRTLKPRLLGHGADLNRALIGDCILHGGTSPEEFCLDEHATLLSKFIRKRGIRLVIFDPLVAFLGKVCPTDERAVRSLMARVRHVADSNHCCIILIRHLTKRDLAGKALYRGSGSVGVIATARVGLILLPSQIPGERLLATTKNNLADAGPTLRLALDGAVMRVAGTDPRPADELLAAERQTRRRTLDAGHAAAALAELVTHEVSAASVRAELARRGFSAHAIRAGLDIAGIKAVRRGNEWYYVPPAENEPPTATGGTDAVPAESLPVEPSGDERPGDTERDVR
jgi:hypothetical protein